LAPYSTSEKLNWLITSPLKSQYGLDHAKGLMFDNHESFSEAP